MHKIIPRYHTNIFPITSTHTQLTPASKCRRTHIININQFELDETSTLKSLNDVTFSKLLPFNNLKKREGGKKTFRKKNHSTYFRKS